ncbi:MAG: YcxB family protein [Terriglobales bacterium]
MDFQVQWTAREYAAAQTEALRRHPWKTMSGLVYPLLVVIAGLAGLVLGKWAGGGILILIGLVLVGLTFGFARWRWLRAGRKLAQDPPTACSADAKGLTLRTENVVETHAWSEFDGALDAPGFFRLDRPGKKARAVYLPKSRMSETQVQQFRSMLDASVSGKPARAVGV